EETETVRNRAPILAHSFGKILLGPAELGEQPLIGFRLLDGIQVFAEQVLDEGELEALDIRCIAHDGRNTRQACELGGPPAPPTTHETTARHPLVAAHGAA